MEGQSVAPVKSKGQMYEGLAFTFCKTATICLFAQRFALPVAAGLAAVFFVLAHVHGQRETRCVARIPLAIAAAWAAVCAAWVYLYITRGGV